MVITQEYLKENPDHVFVFGDNSLRRGKKGGAVLRDEPNVYGFITKKYPSYNNDAYYRPSEYREIFSKELNKLLNLVNANPNKTYLISQIGSGLANKYRIFDKIINPSIKTSFKEYKNVKFLW